MIKSSKNIALILWIFLFATCSSKGPEPIKLNAEHCEFCGMTISDAKFGAELITDKGKIHKFDDVHCMIAYSKEHNITGAKFFVSIYDKNDTLMPAETAYYIQGGDITSPMMGNSLAFSSEAAANEYLVKFKADAVSWNNLLKNE